MLNISKSALPEDIAGTEYIVPTYGGMMSRRTKNPAEIAIVAFVVRTNPTGQRCALTVSSRVLTLAINM